MGCDGDRDNDDVANGAVVNGDVVSVVVVNGGIIEGTGVETAGERVRAGVEDEGAEGTTSTPTELATELEVVEASATVAGGMMIGVAGGTFIITHPDIPEGNFQRSVEITSWTKSYGIRR